ncbi:MAG: corrinoid protein-associated methyltransferase CpaM [Chloroflexota bacterium]|nr:corrinoid protein-associated methyltransferase CpaM [Chloroflexota bacterium]
MSTFVLMKILESAPSRYDRGIHILTLGSLDGAYDRVTSHIERGHKVLDIGCGTGALTIRAAQKGAQVKGIDVNAQMLEIAQRRIRETGLSSNVELCEMGVAELGSEEAESYSVVMSGLCFSELTEGELIYTLREAMRIMRPGGRLLIADEVSPKSTAKRFFNWLVRFPLVIVTYVVTQTTTRAVRGLPQKVEQAGFLVESTRLNKIASFIELVGKKPAGGAE